MPGYDGKTIGGSTESGGSYVELQMWIGDPEKPEEGLTIESSCIDKICITESMFTLLPTMTVQVVDVGRLFGTYSVKIGDLLNVRLKPRDTQDPDAVQEPIVNGSFVIQTITELPGITPNTYMHRYSCTYAAQKYINEVAVFPAQLLSVAGAVNALKSGGKYEKTTSTQALRAVIEQSGLGFSDDTEDGEVDDKSYWISCNETRAAFCDRVVKHAWVGQGNAPILYADAKGIAHYVTIKDLCQKAGEKIRQEFAYTSPKTGMQKGDKTSVWYTDEAIVNAGGPILNKGGYSLTMAMYNPYNTAKIPYKESNFIGKMMGNDKPYLPIFTGSALSQAKAAVGAIKNAFTNGLQSFDKDRGEGYRMVTWQNNNDRLATVKNANPSMKETVSKAVNAGMHFDSMHNYYTIAEAQNEQVRRSFFQQFAKLVIDTGRQQESFAKSFSVPRLGDVIDVDFSTSEKIDPIHSGRFCIVQIKHSYSAKQPYNIEIVAANDGLYGTRGQ